MSHRLRVPVPSQRPRAASATFARPPAGKGKPARRLDGRTSGDSEVCAGRHQLALMIISASLRHVLPRGGRIWQKVKGRPRKRSVVSHRRHLDTGNTKVRTDGHRLLISECTWIVVRVGQVRGRGRGEASSVPGTVDRRKAKF